MTLFRPFLSLSNARLLLDCAEQLVSDQDRKMEAQGFSSTELYFYDHSVFSGMPSPRSPGSGGLMNGGTPSPPSVTNPASQQLPPACGARQLSKLKRFLTTLQQFGSDISPEIGERVRTLVLGLVVGYV